jgi:hypothetical protein
MKPCLKAHVALRRVQRHPVTKNALRIQKYMGRGLTFGVIPSGLNDIVFHHAPLTIDEAMHIIIDQASISSMTAILAIALLATRSLTD